MKMSQNKETFLSSAKRCCLNARRLLEEAQLLEYEQPPATRYYLSMIAQEEVSKAFILYLVAVEALHWTPFLLRATRDHQCKQLVGIILDYMTPDFDEFRRRMNICVLEKRELKFPSSVTDAMNLLRHEKIRMWESGSPLWDEDPEYDKTALSVVNGKRDIDKQRSLYVELCKNGDVASTPDQVMKTQAEGEYERGRRFESCLSSLLKSEPSGAWDIEKIESCFKLLFSQNVFFESHEE